MQPITSSKAKPLSGTITIPGDKSISHRSLMFGALADGETTITGLLEGEDVLHTADAMRQMGAEIEKNADGTWRVKGVGSKSLCEPKTALEMGNSGTSTRLLMGLVSGYPISTTFTGDASLTKRPMQRIITPLSEMGASFEATDGDKLPLKVHGAQLSSITYDLPIASAQVKSAILLAGLNATGTTTVIESKPTRDHTETMLKGFGVTVETNGKNISIAGGQTLKGCHINVPADPSSAAFPVAAAILTEGSDITIPNVCTNPTRTGVYTALQHMGADIEFLNPRTEGGEPVADLRVRGTGPLNAITLDPALVPSMIDEFPIFAMVAANANGTSIMTDLGELRVKESDRLLMVAEGLKACGISLEMGEDSLTINSNGQAPPGLKEGGGSIKTALDHRIAMAFAILGGITSEPITIDDATPIATSFPGFIDLMNGLGYNIEDANG